MIKTDIMMIKYTDNFKYEKIIIGMASSKNKNKIMLYVNKF